MRMVPGAALAATLLLLPGSAVADNHGPALRVLPLGDSITYGLGDDQLGSYRPALADLLDAAGVTADFVGSQAGGPTGTDRDHEGHIGWRIDRIAAHVDEWMALHRPDLVLLHIGTNDMRSDDKAYGAAQRLSDLVDRLLAADPAVRVVVARIVGAADDDKFGGEFQRRIDVFNDRVPAIVQSKGERVRLADHRAVDGGLLADTFHPNADGYRAMAGVWFHSLLRGRWIAPAREVRELARS